MQTPLGEGWVNLDIWPLEWVRNHNTVPIFQVKKIYFPLHLEIQNGINCPGHTSPTHPVLLPIVSLTLSKWFKIYFPEIKLSVLFPQVGWFPERTIESLLLLWSEENISTKVITPSCPTVGSVLLVTKSMIWSVPLNVLWKGMSALHFPLSLPRHSLVHQIHNVSFTHWLSSFSGKWENNTVVLVKPRIFKEKKFFLLILNAQLVSRSLKQSKNLFFVIFSTKDLRSLTRDGISSPCIGSVASSPLNRQGSPDSGCFLGGLFFMDRFGQPCE